MGTLAQESENEQLIHNYPQGYPQKVRCKEKVEMKTFAFSNRVQKNGRFIAESSVRVGRKCSNQTNLPLRKEIKMMKSLFSSFSHVTCMLVKCLHTMGR